MLVDAKGKRFRLKSEAKQGHLIIYVSPSYKGPWDPLKPEDVPEWIKDQDILGELVAGQMCSDPKKDGKWYRAEKLQAH